MSKFIALLPDENVADEVTKKLDRLNADSLDWNIIEDEDRDRILPAIGWPLGASTGGTAGVGAPGVVIHGDYPEDRVVADEGINENDADYYGRSIANGGVGIVVEVADRFDNDVHQILETAGASQINKE